METQARATDPITSHISAARVNTGKWDFKILNYLSEEGPANVYVISQMIEAKETTVSSACSRLCREDKIHSVGIAESAETGHDRIVYAHGPDPSGCGPDHKMPVRQTGPRNQKLIPDLNYTVFMPGEVRAKLAELTSVDEFTLWLNKELVKRVVLSFE